MNVQETVEMALMQANYGIEDLNDFVPMIYEYVNEGYDKLFYAYTSTHPPSKLAMTSDIDLPSFAHKAVADYTTWSLLRNGSQAKQNRGYAYLSAFNEIRAELIQQAIGSAGAGANYFVNIPD